MSPEMKKQKPSETPEPDVQADAGASPAPRDPPAGPLFALGVDQAHASHPDALTLLEAYTRFQAGDFRATRGHLNTIEASEADTPKTVAEASRALRAAMDLDPATLIFAASCLALFIVILVLVY